MTAAPDHHEYDGIADSYEQRKLASRHSPWAEVLQERLLTWAAQGPVLDLGCGPGVEAHRMALQGREVIGLDLSWRMLERAAARTAPLVQADADALPFADHTFAAVWSMHVLLHLEDLRLPLAEVARVLRPRGIAALTFALGESVTVEQVPWHPEHVRRFVHRSAHEVNEALAAAGHVQSSSGDDTEGRPTRWVIAASDS